MLICCGHCQLRLFWTSRNMFSKCGTQQKLCFCKPLVESLTPSTDRGPCVHCWSALRTNHHMTNIQPWRLLLHFLFSPCIHLVFLFSKFPPLHLHHLSFLLMYNLINILSSRLTHLKCTVDFLLPEPYPSLQKPPSNSYFPLSSPGPASDNH